MRRRWLRGLAALVALSSIAIGCGDDGGGPGSVVVPDGFSTAAVVIRRADGTVCNLCTYVARTREERAKGLMGVTDLAGHDGMIFVYDDPTTLLFWMKDTVMPLSAAWFGAAGAFVAAFDMAPCAPDTAHCPTYGPGGDALDVLEVPQGDLARLAIGDGAVLVSVGAACDP